MTKTNRLQDITVIIPVLNEEASIGLVLADLPDDLVSRVIVVDNGSTDRRVRSLQMQGLSS